MIQFVSGNIEQATELMLFNSAEILLKLELYLKNIFQIRSNTSFKYKYKYKYTNLVFFKYKYKYKYKYLRIWIQIQIQIRIWTQPWWQPIIWSNDSLVFNELRQALDGLPAGLLPGTIKHREATIKWREDEG